MITNSTKDTGRNPAVVSAIRRTFGDQRASVSCIIPAMAGPVTASPDQNTRFTRYIDQAWRASADSTPSTNATAPKSARTTHTILMPRVPSFGRQRPQVVHDAPRLLGGERLRVGGHHRAAGHDVAVPVAVGAGALQRGVGEVRRRHELGRDGPGDAALGLGAVTGQAERLVALLADGGRLGRRLDGIGLLGRQLALLL